MRSSYLIAATLLTAALVLSSCGISKEAYQRDMSRLKGQVTGLEDDKERLVRQRKELQTQLSAVSAEKGKATAAMLEALQRVQELEAVAAKREAVFQQLTASLRSMATAGKLRVVRKRGRLVIQMAEAILFDSGKSKLKDEGVDAIAELTRTLAAIPGRHFQISGHTDNVGSETFNWKLSCDRALAVLETMREAGMPPDSVSVAGYAWFVPDVSNDTEEGRAQNRRIEFVLVPNLEELELPE